MSETRYPCTYSQCFNQYHLTPECPNTRVGYDTIQARYRAASPQGGFTDLPDGTSRYLPRQDPGEHLNVSTGFTDVSNQEFVEIKAGERLAIVVRPNPDSPEGLDNMDRPHFVQDLGMKEWVSSAERLPDKQGYLLRTHVALRDETHDPVENMLALGNAAKYDEQDEGSSDFLKHEVYVERAPAVGDTVARSTGDYIGERGRIVSENSDQYRVSWENMTTGDTEYPKDVRRIAGKERGYDSAFHRAVF